MVRIYKEQFGRGPTKARTHYAGPDVLVCLLEHTLTPAERNLQRLGEHERLQDMRMFFQYAQTATFTEPIERITGRRVRAFISGLDTNADIASELFVLEPDLPRETPHDPSGAEETEPTGTLSKTRRSVSPHSRIADRHRPDATEEPKSQLS